MKKFIIHLTYTFDAPNPKGHHKHYFFNLVGRLGSNTIPSSEAFKEWEKEIF